MRSNGASYNGVTGKQCTSKNGETGWIYPSERSLKNRCQSKFAMPSIGIRRERAENSTLNLVYGKLLKLCPPSNECLRRFYKDRGLEPEVAAHLIDRGFGQLKRNTNRTEICKQLVDQGLEEHLAGTPGFYIDRRSRQDKWNLAGASGLMIPVCDLHGRIVAVSIRADAPSNDQPRYSWLTSASNNRGGSSPGTPIHIPLFHGEKTTIRITEGALKAEIATKLSGVLTLGTSGVSRDGLAEIIRQISPTRILIAYDADFKKNPHVRRAILDQCDAAANWSEEVLVEYWPLEEAKGIDDLLAKGGQAITITPNEFGNHQISTDTTEETSLYVQTKQTLAKIGSVKPLLSSGILDLDHSLGGGLAFGEYVAIGGRPGHGKSALAFQIGNAIAAQGVNTCIVTEEMNFDEVGQRTISHISCIARCSWEQERSIIEAEIGDFFEGRSSIRLARGIETAEDLHQFCERSSNAGHKAVIVDYLQLFDAAGARNDYERVTKTNKICQKIAKSLQMLVIGIVQINREAEKRHGRTPTLDDIIPSLSEIKGSGQIEQDIDVAIFGVWPCKYIQNHDPNDYVLVVRKNRNRGQTDAPFRVRFNPERMKFLDSGIELIPFEKK